MRFFNANTNLANGPMHRALELMFDASAPPFLTKWDWDRLSDHDVNFFTVPVGEGWTDDALNLRFSIPGVTRDAFSLTHQGSRLTLRGERRKPDQLESSRHVQYGLPYGRFERSLELPPDLDFTRMRARLHHGVLDVQIPLQDSIKAQAIPVEEAAAVA